MYDHEDVERLRELVVDERARRAYAEKQLLAERRRSEAWRSRVEEQKAAERIRRKGLRWLINLMRRRRRSTRGTPRETLPKDRIKPTTRPRPRYPTLRIAAWNPPNWLPKGAECIPLDQDKDSLASADMVLVGGTGALGRLNDWLTLPARQPVVLWDWGEHESQDWKRYLTDQDLVVGSRRLGAAKLLAPWPVVDPRDTFSASAKSIGSDSEVATTDTPLSEIVTRALMRAPMEWHEADAPQELARLVVTDTVDRRKAGVLSRLVASERFGPGAAIERIANEVGLQLPSTLPSVGILLVTRWPDRLEGALEHIAGLRYPRFDLVVGLHGIKPSNAVRSRLESLGIGDRVKFVEFDERLSLGECLNRSAEATGSSVLAKFDDDDRYGRWYLDEAVDALRSTDAELVGKATQYVHLSHSNQLILYQPGKEHTEVGYVNGPTFVMPRHTWEQVRFPHRRSRVDSIFVRGLKAMGGTIWSTSRYEFLLGRHAEGHTWEASDERFLTVSDVVGTGSDDAAVWLENQRNRDAGVSTV